MVRACTIMNSIWKILLSLAFTFSVIVQSDTQDSEIVAGYVPGLAGMPPINSTNCESDPIIEDESLSNALECARTCHSGDKPRTCYYKFVVERYPVSGQACGLCTPNVSNSICPNCQCVPTDGVQRMALTVNRMIPGPSIQICLGDYVVVDVINKIQEDAITIHWHGVFQKNYQYYDGVPMLTQCPIVSSTTFRYQFKVQNSGTHFWHAHTGLDKMDGVFGSFIVRDAIETDPNNKYFETDLASHVVVINDWMHEESTERFPGRNASVVGQQPDTFLINGKGQSINKDGTSTNTSLEVIQIEPNKLHRFRLVNSFCSTCPGQLTIQNHNLTVIAVDGENVEPVVVDSIVSFAGERYDFVINASQTPGFYWIQLRGLDECIFTGTQQLAVLQYVDACDLPATPRPSYNAGLSPGVVLNPLDASCQTENPTVICINQLNSISPVGASFSQSKADYQFFLPIGFHAYSMQDLYEPNQYNSFLVPAPGIALSAFVDNITFQFPPSPPLSQFEDLPPNQFCNSSGLPPSCNGFCRCTNVLSVPLNALVEIVLVDESKLVNLTHPFHMHGYAFRVVSMGQPLGPYSFTGNTTGITTDFVRELESRGSIERNLNNPPGKDTIAVPNNGYVVLRLVTDNPGYWLFHCHFIYHQIVGMDFVVHVGSQDDLPPVPSGFPKCGNFQLDIPYDDQGGNC